MRRMESDAKDYKRYTVANYCVLFVDALGYRQLFDGEGLLPNLDEKKAKDAFNEKIQNTIGHIDKLQRIAEEMHSVWLEAYEVQHHQFPPSVLKDLQKATRTTIKSEHWSDGLMYYTPIAESQVECPSSGLYALIAMSGILCHLHLADKRPIRGGMELAWAAEISTGALLGAAPVRAYELESEVAEYPRIVIGPLLLGFLHSHKKVQARTVFEKIDATMAEASLSLLTTDDKGITFVDYLSETFATQPDFDKMATAAYDFVKEQHKTHHLNGNDRLVKRYTLLLDYFHARGVNGIANI